MSRRELDEGSATAAAVERGSTHSLALRFACFHDETEPTGWFPRVAPIARRHPHSESVSRGIAPRPNVAARLATSGPCHIRAAVESGTTRRRAEGLTRRD